MALAMCFPPAQAIMCRGEDWSTRMSKVISEGVPVKSGPQMPKPSTTSATGIAGWVLSLGMPLRSTAKLVARAGSGTPAQQTAAAVPHDVFRAMEMKVKGGASARPQRTTSTVAVAVTGFGIEPAPGAGVYLHSILVKFRLRNSIGRESAALVAEVGARRALEKLLTNTLVNVTT